MNEIADSEIRKKIIFTSNTSYSLYNFRLGLMRALKRAGFDVLFFAPIDEYTEILSREFDYRTIKYLDRKGTNPLKDLRLFWEYLQWYIKIKPDLVINYTIKPNIYSSLACGILSIPCISVVTGLGYVYQRGGFLKFLVSLLYGLSFKFSKKVIILNREDLEELKKITSEKKLVLIKGEGVNTSYFSPEICTKFMDEKQEEKIVFLYLGRFLKDKGIFELIEAGKRLWNERKNFEIWLVGDIDRGNPESLNYEDLEKLKKLSFLRLFPFTDDVRQYLCRSDVVVYPSSYREGIPRALLEAMAMEKPIITTDAPGCRDTVYEGKNGILVKPEDVESLHSAMLNFMKMPKEQRLRMGKEGRRIVIENFDEGLIISKYFEIIYV